jgi:hypothetical protein
MALALLALMPAGLAASESLRGSRASMKHQHGVAKVEALEFQRTASEVMARVKNGALVALAGNDDYQLANVSFAYAVPEVRLLVERLSRQYRGACGEPLVVTSLTRPTRNQPRNAHALSVHPAGMAVDLRISDQAKCRSWVEGTLLSLERANVLDVTRERHPPHYHVAVFPSAYRDYVERLEAGNPPPAVKQTIASLEPVIAHAAMVTPVAADGQRSDVWEFVLVSVLMMMLVGIRLKQRTAVDSSAGVGVARSGAVST